MDKAKIVARMSGKKSKSPVGKSAFLARMAAGRAKAGRGMAVASMPNLLGRAMTAAPGK